MDTEPFLPPRPPRGEPQPRLSIEDMVAGKGSALNDVLTTDADDVLGDIPKITTVEGFMQALKTLESAILERQEGEASLTTVITDAAKTGDIARIIPKVPLRTGLQPGVLPGLVDTSTTTAALLPSLIGPDLARNVEAVSHVLADPDGPRQLQERLPEAMPDSPQLHPLSKFREQMAAHKANNVPLSMDGPPVPSLLETSVHSKDSHHHHHSDAHSLDTLRKDQAIDLQYLRGIGQGVGMLAEWFGGADPDVQRQLLQVSAALKTVGSGVEDPLVSSFLEAAAMYDGMYRPPPAYGHQSGNVPLASVADRDGGKGPLLAPGTYASAPMAPLTAPNQPRDELSWMLDGVEAKGYAIDSDVNPPQPIDFKRMLETLKGFFKKGQKMLDMAESAGAAPDPGYKNTGFEGWPQPFWWTRPPNWLDDVPAWMQRLQLKRAGRMHSGTPYR